MTLKISSKKGMSPLIATVLVIAFAVAIGVMILNWTSDISKTTTTSPTDYCDGVSLSVNSVVCYDGSSIVLHAKNTGTKKFDGVMIKSSTPNGDLDFKIKDSAMIARESIDKTVPFTGNEGVSIQIVPFINVDGSAVACLPGAYSQDDLPLC